MFAKKAIFHVFSVVLVTISLLAQTKLALARVNATDMDMNYDQGSAYSHKNNISGGFHVNGTSLLDANGNDFIMRGINHPHTWYPSKTNSLAHIKATGTNTVRVVLSNGSRWTANSASDVANVINLCKTYKLVCILEVHDTTGYGEQTGATSLMQAVNYWKSLEIDGKNILFGEEAYVIINIGNEPYGNVGATGWVNDTKSAITEMRNAGFQHTLMVDAPNWGQDWQFVMRDHASEVFASDPNRNTIFSIHMYGVFDTETKIQEYINSFIVANLVLVIGEFGYDYSTVHTNQEAIMAIAQSNDIGYLGWSWSGNGGSDAYLDMVPNFDPSQRTQWGNRIIGGENGICQTAYEASIYGGDAIPRVCSVSLVNPNPTSAANVDFTVTFSEAVTGVDTSDFTLTTSDVLATSVISVSGSDAIRTVTVNTGMGSGTIRLDVLNNGSILDLTSNPLSGATFIHGGSYTVTKVWNIATTIGGAPQGYYNLASGQSTRANYAGVNNGPVKIASTNSMNIIAAERVNFFVGSTVTSYAEMMGLPDGQLDTTYWFPWYKNDSQVSTQIRIGNVSGSEAHVHISIAGAEVAGSPYTLTTTGNGQSMRLEYAANNGPVKIWSDQNIVATERVNFFIGSTVASYTEIMGLPNSQLDITYWFPWYKNVGDGTDTQLRIGNVSGSTATVHIYIAGAEVAGSPYTLTTTGDTQSMRLSYVANNGPVKIVSDQNIVASERINYFVDGVVTSYSEMMGQPNSQLDTTYWFPWYKNDSQVDTQIRIGNVSGSEAHVHVYIGTAEMPGSPFTLTTTGSTQSMRLSFTANDGPVKIVSDQNIVATERVNFFVGSKVASYSEMMGLPNIQLDTTYWFPWYKNVGDGIDTQLRFGIP